MAYRLHDKDDGELLQMFYETGNNELLGIILQRYTSMLLGVCMKYLKNDEDAKDSVQQIFFKVINELHKYKVAYFKSWLYMIAKNYCLMKLRDKNKNTLELTDKMTQQDNDGEHKLKAIEKEKALTELEAALQLLNAEQRICVTLFYLQKKSYQQITMQTGYSTLQVKSNIQNGKRNLKLQMNRMSSHEQ